ncbi:type I restriction modification DNA specificity domain protein [Streptococcus mitis]|uniref:restriction endonuclease subunit S n=1 Tax=Streptococcus mitis TaxID=28037 RepID=UPI0004D7EA48|nr:restriction endonuclease subunit S [Streptococcus mitis]QBZ12716.1 type I restriction modification DNA specificity domain protein [Streptococcus mitis]
MTKKPSYRFAGYIEPWAEKKLGVVAEFTKGKGYSKGDLEISGVPIILYGRLYTNYQTIIDDIDTYVTMKENSVLSEGNEIIVPSSGESSEEISRASVVSKSGVILGGDLNIIKLNATFSSVFVAITLSNGAQQKELSKRAQGKSVVHLHNSDLKEVNLSFPSLPEQTAIGSFFQDIDQLISLQQRKLEVLKEQKKTYLKLLFPAKGQTKPALRFAGFEDDWKEVKLGEIGVTKSGVGFPDSEQGGVKGIPFYKVSDMNNIGNEIEMVTSNNYVTQDQIDSRKWKVIDTVPAIMFAKVGAALLLNRKRLIREPFLIDNNTMVYIPSVYWDVMFCKILFDTLNLSKYSQVGALPSYNGSDIEAIQVSIPTLPEQEAIGSFFQDLDKAIAKQEEKVNQLKESKQTLLRKMFI